MLKSLQVGFVGLSRMGLPMAQLLEQQHEIVGHDIDLPIEPDFECIDNFQKLLGKQQGRKIVWLMVPTGAVTEGLPSFHPSFIKVILLSTAVTRTGRQTLDMQKHLQ